MFVFAPTEQAGPNPPGEVYDLQKDIDDKFPTPVHYASFVIEAKNGDVLTQHVLYELDQNIFSLLENIKKWVIFFKLKFNLSYFRTMILI